MSGHTPGPWQTGLPLAEKEHDMHRMVYCDDSLGSRIADCSTAGHGISNAQQLANARLIAAAPQMLEALELAYGVLKMRSNFAIEPPEAVVVRAAIDAAKGTP